MVLAEEDLSYLYPVPIATLEPVAERNFAQEYTNQQIESWQEYATSVLKGIDAVGLVKSTLGTVLRNPDHIRMPERLTTERIAYTFTHADGSEEEATFGMTGMKIRLRTGRKDASAYVLVGIKSRGEDDRQDLDISRELGVFLVESANGKTTVTYGQTNRELPVWTDTNPSRISPLFLEHVQGNVQNELTQIATKYSEKLVNNAAAPTRRGRIPMRIG